MKKIVICLFLGTISIISCNVAPLKVQKYPITPYSDHRYYIKNICLPQNLGYKMGYARTISFRVADMSCANSTPCETIVIEMLWGEETEHSFFVKSDNSEDIIEKRVFRINNREVYEKIMYQSFSIGHKYRHMICVKYPPQSSNDIFKCVIITYENEIPTDVEQLKKYSKSIMETLEME